MIMYNATIPDMTYIMTSIAQAAISRNTMNTKKRRANIITLSFLLAHQPRMCGYYKKESVRLFVLSDDRHLAWPKSK